MDEVDGFFFFASAELNEEVELHVHSDNMIDYAWDGKESWKTCLQMWKQWLTVFLKVVVHIKWTSEQLHEKA